MAPKNSARRLNDKPAQILMLMNGTCGNAPRLDQPWMILDDR